MNQYYKDLFDNMGLDERNILCDMIFRIGNADLSFNDWKSTLSDTEKQFAAVLATKYNNEFLCGVIEENEPYLFPELLLYYSIYNPELGWAVPNIGIVYGEAMKQLSTS